MLEKFIFENHLGQRFEGLPNGVFMNYNDLRDYSWSYDTINNRISRFYMGTKSRKLPLVIKGKTDEESVAVMNRLHELAEADIEAKIPGRIYVGDYYTNGYITGSTKSNYLVKKRFCNIELTLTSDDPAWYREKTHQFIFTSGGDLEPSVAKYVEGSNITINDSSDGIVKGLTIYGKTTQLQTTGAQLLDHSTIGGRTVNGLTLTRNDDGYLNIKGTATKTDQSTIATLTKYFTLTPGTYTLSVDKPLSVRIRFNTTSFLSLGPGKTSVTSTITDEFEVKNIAIHYTNGVTYDETFRLMLSKSEEALPYEPYTDGKIAPNIDYPMPLNSAGTDGEISISIEDAENEFTQTISISTPNGLPGVPVESGGNYIDENGQHWICDEIDFERGVYIKRCAVEVLTTDNVLIAYPSAENDVSVKVLHSYIGVAGAVCNYLPVTTDASSVGIPHTLYVGDVDGYVITLGTEMEGSEELYWYLNNIENNELPPFTIIRGMRSDYWEEAPLSAEELAQYAKLHSYKPSTIVYNDSGAYMVIGYYPKNENDNPNDNPDVPTVVNGFDYPYDYQHDYAILTKNGRTIICDTYGSNAFRLFIYGEAVNPSIVIGGHVYSINGTIGKGETLLIDSLAKTITLTTAAGNNINWFDKRGREDYIFEPIPTGQNTVSWIGTFGFDLTVIEKRSEPRWT